MKFILAVKASGKLLKKYCPMYEREINPMRKPINPASIYLSSTSQFLSSAIIFFTALIYLLLQQIQTGEIVDSVFVSLLLLSVMVLIFSLRYWSGVIIKKGLALLDIFSREKAKLPKGVDQEDLWIYIFNQKRMTITGLLYALLISSSPWVIGVWEDNQVLQLSLAAFLFAVNFITGAACYSLFAFFVYAQKVGSVVTVNLWQINNPTTDFFLSLTRHTVIIVAVIVAIANSGILFSKYEIGTYIYFYFMASGLLILLSLFIPAFPIMRQLRKAKQEALTDLDKQLHLSFYESLSDADRKRSELDFDRIKTLIELREKVSSISTWPFKAKAFGTGFYVIILSAVPVLLQVVLEQTLQK